MDEVQDQLLSKHNEVQRKIGRNLLLYQQIEHFLKHLVSISHLSAPIHDLKIAAEKRKAKYGTNMLGQIIEKFFDEYLLEKGIAEKSHPESTDEYFEINHHLLVGRNFRNKLRLDLDTILEDRNELVHHLLPKWNPDSLDSTVAISIYLEEKREQALPTISFLQSLWKNLQDTSKFISSPLIKNFFSGRLLKLLMEFPSMKGNDNDWVSLDAARHMLHQHAAEELANIKELFACSTLQELVQNCGLFETNEVKTVKGGKRLDYRLKRGVSLEID